MSSITSSIPMLPGDSPHLLWVTENYYPSRGGMAWSCDRIVHGLRRRGLRVDVLYFRRRKAIHGAPRVKTLSRLNGRDLIWPVDDDPAHAMNCAWNYLEAQHATGPPEGPGFSHVVAFGGLLALLAAPVYASWLDRPLVTLLRGNDFDIGIFSAKRSDLLIRALEKSARVCVVSRDKVAKVAALFPQLEPPVWIPNGIDLESWKIMPADLRRAATWRRKTVAKGRRVLGFFGQIKKKKGGLFFLENLRRTEPLERFHLLFVGDLSPGVADWLAANEGEVTASHEPFLDRYQLLPLYAACDLVVIPSFYDGLPNVLLEAGGLGLPLLASYAGGMADVLLDGRHGFVFPPGDDTACRRAIHRAAAASDEELRDLGKALKELIRSRFDHHGETTAYFELFTEGQRPSSQPMASADPTPAESRFGGAS